ncbi:aldehyde dehydrogenase [Pontibacter sp. HSC-36F09]|uniref:aldehyde dehydrogenase n=1 Tax=Pontibacter sp. HSC-36F09 TaxID=2910966 RepID=UPI0020A187A1|nr:aldehyde dehydrogenase [Pontibacter sp. HSC-36F09]MCP2045467.1 aldehyde dehydrogenase (NAD+) [Pontibacter sp. HSC-36F09]
MNSTNTFVTKVIPAREADPQAVLDLLQQQRAFFAGGHTLDVSFRKEQLQRLLEAVRSHEQELIDAMYTDFRKPAFETFTTEIGFVEKELQLVLKNIVRWARPKAVSETLLNFPARSYIYSQPYGVALIIGPWNYPLQLVLNPLIGALAAGNCAIIKPSELTPATSAVIARLIAKTFDPRLVAVVEGGVSTTQHLLAQRFNYIFFTGSTQVGRVVMKAAAEHLTPVTLELGGKSPVIVAEDADLGLAARRIAWGKFMNAGQTCVAPDYLLVQEQVKDELIERLRIAIQEFYGDSPRHSPDFARIINDRHYQRLNSYLQDGVVRIGGQHDAESRFIAPTVLDQVDWQHPVMQDEIFGPILPVLTYTHLDDAIRQVNAREKPLALYFFSSDKWEQQQVLEQVHFGGGCINDTISHLINPKLPFGGVGESGVGSYHGRASFELFSNQKSVVHRGTWLDLPLRYPPYGNRLALIKKVFKWL